MMMKKKTMTTNSDDDNDCDGAEDDANDSNDRTVSQIWLISMHLKAKYSVKTNVPYANPRLL